MLGRVAAFFVAAIMLVMTGSPANARWYEASSEHFVIYADDREKDILRFTEQLERYHSAMERVTGRIVDSPSPSNRVTIYVVGDERDIRKLVGDKRSNVAGFYLARAGGSVAFVQDIRFKSGYPDFSLTVLLHEYAHHFLISTSRHAMPRWMSEGAAEFFAAASFPKDGGVQVGKPALHRAGDLFYADDVSIHELFDHELYQQNRGRKFDAYYGRSWLLYHYLMLSQRRPRQLSQYWRLLGDGVGSTAAAEQIFGDLDELEKELDAYLRERKMYHLDFSADMIETKPVSVRELSEGEAAIMPLVIQSKRGVNEEQAAELVVDVREVALEFPNDASVQAALAEAEFDAGNNEAAIAAADRAIALDPTTKNAYVQKGYALFEIAADADDVDTAYRVAMKPFEALNKLEADHPLPLIYYYRSYAERGVRPTENARHALERASELAPFDQGLTMNVAMMMINEGKHALASLFLKPLAADPHNSGLASSAQSLIETLAELEDGDAFTYPSGPVVEATESDELGDPATGPEGEPTSS